MGSHGKELYPSKPQPDTNLSPSSDTLRAMAVQWLFLGSHESPFLHCSKDLDTVKEQAWNMGQHHLIVRVQMKNALDRDDVIDMSSHEAQVGFFREVAWVKGP